MLWSAEALGAALDGPVNFSAAGVSIDSRTLRPGELFVALEDTRDGHAFVGEALAKGAAGALVRRGVLHTDARLIEVEEPLAALGALGRFARARFEGRVAAVTGSVGKTTTKEMLRTALASQGPVHAADASFNNHIGVPLTLARMPADAKFAVIEIGMNHPGEIAPLAALARPHVAVVTHIGTAHIGHMGSIGAIAAEKAAIFGGLTTGGLAVIPPDVAERAVLERAARQADARLIRVGAEGEAEIVSEKLDAQGSDLVLRGRGQEIAFRLNVPGRHMARNAALAIAAAWGLGADPWGAAQALAEFAPVAGRGVRKPIIGGRATLLDESYNASPSSVRAALALLDLISARRRIAVLGDMREMGAAGPAEHAGLAPDVVEHADLLFTCGSLMGHLHASVPASVAVMHAEDSLHLAPEVAQAIEPGDLVLVKGSLGSNMRLVVEALAALPGDG